MRFALHRIKTLARAASRARASEHASRASEQSGGEKQGVGANENHALLASTHAAEIKARAAEFDAAIDLLAGVVGSWSALKEVGGSAVQMERVCRVETGVARRVAAAVGAVMKPERLLAALFHMLLAPVEAHLNPVSAASECG